jgi:hypothetical protein
MSAAGLATAEHGEIGPNSTRGWTLQERLLSNRLLTYTEAAFRLEYLTQSTMECQFRAAGSTQLGPLREGNHGVDWETLLHWYTGRRLTVATDRLPAISVLARRIVVGCPTLARNLSSRLASASI